MQWDNDRGWNFVFSFAEGFVALTLLFWLIRLLDLLR